MAEVDEVEILSPNVVNTLITSMLPVNVHLEFQTHLLPTRFSQSSHWQSLLLIGQNQVQRNGLLFQVALTNAFLGKQVTCIMKKEFNRFPPTTHGLPKMEPENMVNITFRYCQEFKNIENLLLSYCDFPVDLLPDVLVVNGLDEYFEPKNCQLQFYFSKALSLLSETTEYISRRKKTKCLLYVSAHIGNNYVTNPHDMIQALKRWVHEVWVLQGNSNRLVCGNTQIQFMVLGPNIFLKTVTTNMEP